MEETLEGKDRNAGVLERIRDLEDEGLIATAKKAGVMAIVSLLVTAAPLLAVVLPAVQRLQESIDRKPAAPVAIGVKP